MRPRSRLLTKRGLPTIREGYEELVQDLNQTNSQHSTTQDYLLSICHLARPTFPLHEPDCDILSIGPLDPPKTCIRLLRQHLQQRSTICPAQLTPNHSQTTQSHSGEEEEGPGPSDPLEYLYSHAGELPISTRRGSLPPRRPEKPPEMRRKSSCPELGLAETVTVQSLLQRSPISRRKLEDGAPAGWRGKSNRAVDKQTMVSHWIAECRSAWKEARVHACMLPSIAEK